ncbi:PREDICTED: deoxynucleotidyltransferase terminal-interacting protein 2 isoform X2 [Eufriesea mexicana]|uniref:deoxynucleotidyltransferase terminal-interacting protein 2 isoform X2 n=1 Tax=Eufriesea mexicana TaxID=516756 RepID=UPI00083BF6F7|nr:PREDICTED: deoxynucleotidyltransferase terminal-interacting protein 2 isoform X2 [Eufriesea mexicana]
MDIIIDTKGEADLVTKDRLVDSDEDDLNFENSEENLIKNETSSKRTIRNVTKDIDLEEFEKDLGWSKQNRNNNVVSAPNISCLTQELTPAEKILEKSIIKPGFEQLQAVPPYELTKKLQDLKRRERDKTKGKNWFNMGAPELTPEIKYDLQVIKMRSVLDPKRFYKKNDLKVLPKYFQIGKVMDAPRDYYSGRLTKKERKKTIVDELMADAEFAKYNKRKYKEIIEEKKKLHYKAHKHAKRLKGKRK